MLGWFVGLGPKPTFERWAYWEKFDFWGACTDIIIIGIDRADPVVPQSLLQLPPGDDPERRQGDPLHAGPAGHGIRLRDPFLQHALPGGEVPRGHVGADRPGERGGDGATSGPSTSSGCGAKASWSNCRPSSRRGSSFGLRGWAASWRWRWAWACCCRSSSPAWRNEDIAMSDRASSVPPQMPEPDPAAVRPRGGRFRAPGRETALAGRRARSRSASWRSSGGCSSCSADGWGGRLVHLAAGVLQQLPHHGAVLQVLAGIEPQGRLLHRVPLPPGLWREDPRQDAGAGAVGQVRDHQRGPAPGGRDPRRKLPPLRLPRDPAALRPSEISTASPSTIPRTSGTLRRGKKLRCTSCHSQIVQGSTWR